MLEEFSKALDYCTYCPKMCSFSCPVSTVEQNEMTTPWGKMQAANLVNKDMIALDEDIAALSYKCTDCRLCQQYCTHHIDISEVLHEVRKLAVETHVAPKALLGFLDKFHIHHNPYGKDLLPKLESLVPEKYRKQNASTLYFVGCSTLAQTPEVIVDTFEIFDKLGVDDVYVHLDPMQCCGYPLYAAGVEDEFEDMAEFNYQAFRKYRRVISSSPTCVYTMRELYSKFHFNLGSRTMTMPEFLKPYLKHANYTLKKKQTTRYMYQDSCYLGRYLGEYGTPRELLHIATSRAPIEFHENRNESTCCGQGGCYSITSPEASDQISNLRLTEVKEKHVGTLIAHCPSCVTKFRKNSEGLVVKDIISFLNEAINETGEPSA